jgi:hypothetical protein
MKKIQVKDKIEAVDPHAESPEQFSDEALPSKLTQPKKRESRSARWARAASDAEIALSELQELQSEFQDWLDNLPENLASTALGEKLEAVTNIDVGAALDIAQEATEADLPKGFGRD